MDTTNTNELFTEDELKSISRSKISKALISAAYSVPGEATSALARSAAPSGYTDTVAGYSGRITALEKSGVFKRERVGSSLRVYLTDKGEAIRQALNIK